MDCLRIPRRLMATLGALAQRLTTVLVIIRCTKMPRLEPMDFTIVHGKDGTHYVPTSPRSSSATTSMNLRIRTHAPVVFTNHPRCSKFVDSHLKPYRCKVHACENARFSSTACLLRHEREAHAMHGHGEKPFLCRFDGCDRGIPGNGFPRHWNLRDHMKRVHNLSPSPTSGKSQPTRGGRKRKAETTESATPATKKTAPEPAADPYSVEPTVPKLSLSDQWQQRRRQLLQSVQLLEESDPTDVATMHKIQVANNCLKDMHRTTQLMKGAPEMSRTKSQQSG